MFPQPLCVGGQNFFDIFTRQGYYETILVDRVFAGAKLQQVFEIKCSKLILGTRQPAFFLRLLTVTPAEQ